MTQPLECNCPECQRLDKLPVRLQGWAGCKQLLLPGTRHVAQIDWPELEPYNPTGPSQKGVDDLPLFNPNSQPLLL